MKSLSLAALGMMLAAPLWAHGTEEHDMHHPEGVIHVHEAYARVNGTKSGAIFFMIHNNTEVDDRLIGASSDVAKKVELHSHEQSSDGVMRMVHLEEGIALPWGEMHPLERGGDHVMLMGLTRELKEGETFTLTLDFEKHEDVVVDVVVDNARQAGASEHSHH